LQVALISADATMVFKRRSDRLRLFMGPRSSENESKSQVLGQGDLQEIHGSSELRKNRKSW
jgi:hypothetical protein